MATQAVHQNFAFDEESQIFKSLKVQARAIAAPLASLKLTVTLFALSVLLIFIGTLAQAQPGMNMWRVIDKYFRSYLVIVDLSVFFVPGWFGDLHTRVPGWLKFPFPGGFSIGVAMAVNLVAAHLLRFKIQSKGPTLAFGALILTVGTMITYFVIAGGHKVDGLQGQPPFDWPVLWYCLRGCLFGLAGCAVASLVWLKWKTTPTIGQWVLFISLAVVFSGLGVWAWQMMPGESSLRILWQLIQGGLSGLILLAGCYLVFKRRAGIVLLHAGIGLMMFSEFFVSRYVEEGRMTIREGETVNFVRDIREVELAVVDPSKADSDYVIAVPGSRLRPKRTLFGSSSNEVVVVKDENLPFDVHVKKYMTNSNLVDLEEFKQDNPATKGSGLEVAAVEMKASDGTESEVDYAAAYVELKKKDSEDSLGTFLLSQLIAAQGFSERVDVDGKKYEVALRFKREYKPYKLSLKDVRKDDYVGTNMPMNYSSDVVLTKTSLDPSNKQVDSRDESKVGDFHIWMNNPLRYSGETFYQSGYDPGRGNGESTTLQVVSNTGWMMPYIGCMLVSVGMAFHFSGSLWRFLDKSLTLQLAGATDVQSGWIDFVFPLLVVLLFGGYAASKFRPPKDTKANMKIHEFGQLPVVYQGRVKPMDSLARNTLRVVSNREFFRAGPYEGSSMFGEVGKKKPAVQWLLDVVSGSPEAKEHRVYRIDNLDVLRTLGLPRRKRFRYAESEFEGKIPLLQEKLAEAKKVPVDKMSLYQKKLIELERRISAVRLLEAAFLPIPVPEVPTEAEFAADREAAMERIGRIRMFLQNSERMQAALNSMEPPLAVPSGDDQTEWSAFANAWGTAYLARFSGNSVPESTLAWSKILSAYGTTNVNAFNDAVLEYQNQLAENPPSIKNAKGDFLTINLSKLRFEHFFNSSQPFSSSAALYLIAFGFVAAGWAGASVGRSLLFQRSAFWLIVLAFVIHTLALGARIYISGRPPITNLYSSAVFIGWAAVAFGLSIELFYRLGIGNALSAFSGFVTLIIAYALAADGDTFTVLRAVLDTQFWLATHVVCITLGYSTTFVAGLLGAMYVITMAWKRPGFGKALTSMTYGTLCFAIFFSFVGTVLGGLWADDSWGRFWGWDPKENGALIIVLWNALVLHARWGGIVKQKGIALLAIGGNIVTAWSWFGVNELGVGLHSYGFTEGVLMTLALFVASQLLVIFGGLFLIRSTNKSALTAQG